jgi:hypothetical protein
MSVRKARVEPSLGARVVHRSPLFYARGADTALDRAAHVRAGSALARLGPTTLGVVQDDASFLAVLEGVGGALAVHDVPFPAHDSVRQFDDGRGNKKSKLDLEACLACDGTLVAFGSGSSPMRERIVLVDRPTDASPLVTIVEARALYEAMRNEAHFSGSELNIEGAALAGDDDVLFLQRGNGAKSADREPVDASARVARTALLAYLRGLARGDTPPPACPPLRDVVQWDLGKAGGTRLTFTDAVSTASRWTAFLACAEASPDATRDGPVTGVSIGRLDDRTGEIELGTITDERGAPLLDKSEGIALDDHERLRAWLVIDRDDPQSPAELLELRLGDRWQT